MPAKLREAQIATLRSAFDRGISTLQAARLADTSQATAWNYFNGFASSGLTEPQRRWSSRFDPPIPHYDGPDWIGKAADGIEQTNKARR